MPIEYSSADRTFFLHAGEATYAMKVLTHGFLAHLYWGKKIGIQELDFVFQLRERAFSPNPDGLGKELVAVFPARVHKAGLASVHPASNCDVANRSERSR